MFCLSLSTDEGGEGEQKRGREGLTVTPLPHRNLDKSSQSSHVRRISGPSAQRRLRGSISTAERRFEYQARAMVDPSTAGRELLIKIACEAVVIDPRTPNMIPILCEMVQRTLGYERKSEEEEGEVVGGRKGKEKTHRLTLAAPPPYRIPMKKPSVTIPQLTSASLPGSFLYAR